MSRDPDTFNGRLAGKVLRGLRVRGSLRLAVLVLLAGCGRMPARTADASRPALTEERIGRVVQVAGELREKHAELARYLDDGDISIGYDFTQLRMVPATNLVGTDGVAALGAAGEDPQAFVRDLFWMRLAASAARRAGGVDQKMREIRQAERKMSALGLLSSETRHLSGEMHTLLLLHARIGRAEEAAVRARLAEIDRVAFVPIHRRAAARDSLLRLRDSIYRANGLPPR